MNREQFIAQMAPHAQRVSQQTGIDPRMVIAQSAIETGWGKHAPGNNYFGIKSHGQSGGNNLQTTEFRNGRSEVTSANFRGYQDMGQSADDYAAFMQENPRYRPLLEAQGLEAQVGELGRSGYATDPEYGNKVLATAQGIDLGGGGLLSTSGRQQFQSEFSKPEGVETSLLDGPEDPLAQDAMLALNTNVRTNPKAPEGAPLPDSWQTPSQIQQQGRQGGGIVSAQGSQNAQSAPVLAQEAAQAEQQGDTPESFWSKLTGGDDSWFNQNREDALLAIGSGLLSGKTWAEGIGAASENLLGLKSQDKEAQAEKEAATLAHQRDLELVQARGEARDTSGSPYNRPYNLVGRDPETGEEVVRSGTRIDGVDYIPDENGNLVEASMVLNDVRVGGRSETQDVTDGAGGIPNATYVNENGVPAFTFKREGEQKNYQYARRAIQATKDIDKITQSVGADKMTSLTQGLSQWAAQNARGTVSAGTINAIIDDAGISGQARSAMSQYLQAVLRSDTGAAYTGTEIADYAGAFLPNPGDDPETVAYKERVRRNQLSALAGSTGSAAPYLLGVLDGSYTLGNEETVQLPSSEPALNSSNGGPGNSDEIDKLLKEEYGI